MSLPQKLPSQPAVGKPIETCCPSCERCGVSYESLLIMGDICLQSQGLEIHCIVSFMVAVAFQDVFIHRFKHILNS